MDRQRDDGGEDACAADGRHWQRGEASERRRSSILGYGGVPQALIRTAPESPVQFWVFGKLRGGGIDHAMMGTGRVSGICFR